MENYKLQYVSDIHLEKGYLPFSDLIEPDAPDLALVGDIGDPYSQVYADFLKWCSLRWARIFLLTGNHEYFTDVPKPDRTVEKIDEHIHRLCTKISPNIYFLQKGVYLIQEHKVAVLGATLWSAPDLRHWDKLVTGFIGDPGSKGEYNAIFKPDEYTGLMRPYHPTDITALHMDHKCFISKELGPYAEVVPSDYRVIVLSHHMPTYSLNKPEYIDHPLKSCYASPLDYLMKEPLVAWICGHSHDPMSLRYDTGTLVTLNPVGYKNQSKKEFSRNATITVHRENFASSSKGSKPLSKAPL